MVRIHRCQARVLRKYLYTPHVNTIRYELSSIFPIVQRVLGKSNTNTKLLANVSVLLRYECFRRMTCNPSIPYNSYEYTHPTRRCSNLPATPKSTKTSARHSPLRSEPATKAKTSRTTPVFPLRDNAVSGCIITGLPQAEPGWSQAAWPRLVEGQLRGNYITNVNSTPNRGSTLGMEKVIFVGVAVQVSRGERRKVIG